MNTEPLDYAGRKGLEEFQQKSAEVPRPPIEQPQKEEPKQDTNPLTRGEVQGLINSLVESIVKNFAQKGAVDKVARSVELAKNELKRSLLSDPNIKRQMLAWATEAVPPSLRGLDADPTRKLGDTLKLVSGYPVGSDKAVWRSDISGGGLSAEGGQVLYKGVFLREYNAAGVIVAAGSDINPANYATLALYQAALTAAGHTLKPTWDWTRGGTDITP